MSSPVLNHAARILKLVETGTPADQALRESLTQDQHYTAPAERRNVSRAVFTYFRWLRWLEPKDSHQKQLEAALALQERFNKNPASFKPKALAARAVPEWLKDEVSWPEAGAVGGDRPYPTELAWLRQLQREPALWIRTKQGLEAKVTAALGQCLPAGHSALRTAHSAFQYTGLTDLYRAKEFQAGEFEIQDLASQVVGLVCAPRPGETWWDTCAGEGGKTMHLSDLMENKGLLWATDRSVRRLAKLKERASRAKAFNYRAAEWDGGAKLPTKTKFDGVLIDAPCSGVGTWQRNPHARWSTTPKDVQELAVVQAQLLAHAAPALKPGGRLVYSVCTLSRAETTAIADTFTAAHPEFEPFPFSLLATHHPSLYLWPHDLNANGMFIAVWKRK
jgi:16S rRNA (cytosine967-C5)-methyltransferase